MRKVLLGKVLLMSLLNNLEVCLAETEIVHDQTFEELEVFESGFSQEESEVVQTKTTFTNKETDTLQKLHEKYGSPFLSLNEEQKKNKDDMEELEQMQNVVIDYQIRG